MGPGPRPCRGLPPGADFTAAGSAGDLVAGVRTIASKHDPDTRFRLPNRRLRLSRRRRPSLPPRIRIRSGTNPPRRLKLKDPGNNRRSRHRSNRRPRPTKRLADLSRAHGKNRNQQRTSHLRTRSPPARAPASRRAPPVLCTRPDREQRINRRLHRHKCQRITQLSLRPNAQPRPGAEGSPRKRRNSCTAKRRKTALRSPSPIRARHNQEHRRLLSAARNRLHGSLHRIRRHAGRGNRSRAGPTPGAARTLHRSDLLRIRRHRARSGRPVETGRRPANAGISRRRVARSASPALPGDPA